MKNKSNGGFLMVDFFIAAGLIFMAVLISNITLRNIHNSQIRTKNNREQMYREQMIWIKNEAE